MAAPPADVLLRITLDTFRGLNITLPKEFELKQDFYNQKQSPDGAPPSRAGVFMEEGQVPEDCLFQPAMPTRFFADLCVDVDTGLREYLQGICEALAQGWQAWMEDVGCKGVAIATAPVGLVAPGNLSAGPMRTS